MLSLAFKRNYKLIVILVLIFIFSVIFSQTRIISYNFGKYYTQLENTWNNYTNSVNVLDDSIFHEISIDITKEQYDYLIQSYKSNKYLDKEYISVNVVIDWKEIQNVGLRLKGNIDLLEILTENTDTFIKPALLLKFDQYEENQTYQWLSQLALRVDSSDSILWQLVSFKLFQNLWLYSPDTAYTSLDFWELWSYIYMVSEVIDENFVSENFTNTSWVIYKALNSLSFSYLWEDPVSYIDLFEQETNKNNYDMKLLINLFDFVSNSSDEDFEKYFEDYIDMDSFLGMIVMDELMWREDMLLWLLNNYYIYIDTETNKASFIVWDQKMSFSNTQTAIYEILLKYYSKNDLEDIDNITELLKFTQNGIRLEKTDDKWDKTYLNDLRKRFMENEYFYSLYLSKLEDYRQIVFQENLALEYLNYYETVFFSYKNFSNYMDYVTYKNMVNTIINYINNFSLNNN